MKKMFMKTSQYIKYYINETYQLINVYTEKPPAKFVLNIFKGNYKSVKPILGYQITNNIFRA